jgi:hypothetical protein
VERQEFIIEARQGSAVISIWPWLIQDFQVRLQFEKKL